MFFVHDDFVFIGLELSSELLKAIDDFHLLNRTHEELPILESERDTVLATWGE